MTTELPPGFLRGPKIFTLEEVNDVHQRMLNLVKLDKELDAAMMKLTPDPANWEQLWQSQYDDVIEKLEKNDFENLFGKEESEEESTSEGDVDELVEDGGASPKNAQSLRAAMQKQLNLLDKEKKVRSNRIDFFEKFMDVETKRNEMLTQKVALSMKIKDLLEAELNSEEVLDPQQEPVRRAMMSDMARWWDCLLYDMSVELNENMSDEEVGKWSKIYLKWCLWIDLKAGVYDDQIDDIDETQLN